MTNGTTLIELTEKFTQELLKRNQMEMKFHAVDIILTEERTLKHFKSMYVKHVLDSMGEKFLQLYYRQFEFVNKLKHEYKEKYGT